MPYIKQENREFLGKRYKLDIKTGNYDYPTTAGELNYVVTRLCRDYLIDNGVNYATMNEIVGALECCKQELYRRIIGPYENEKIEENGDVY
jgi:hypothetical protein